MPLYDWDNLKKEFLKGPWETIEDFWRDKQADLPKDKNRVLAKTVGWTLEKQGVLSVAVTKVGMSVVSTKAKQIEKMKTRQVRLARLMQNRGQTALKELKPQDTEEARKLLLTGMEQERVLLTEKEKGGSQNLTQVNVNLPKTKLDEILDGQDFEGLLELIAAVRREKARRAGAISVSQE